ncbi:hypothetical protein GE21DRAFT_1964 [Neurospora crassa]|uniref:Uncharacterized protein n=1 Tax=Neurospora crassa (strain ATCC 24698 / 74-OR23-1A / CBS 708.71 / DSM 1257 / FGSC 987) TaxID=367110 RepID=V5IRQ1_NEUCR|nr:hypothetical protein NCU16441 [Neurospora crassa OR74A]ESA44266.1 hypothetical protein NCU16441 [Neurospora crassa OR74A]KHE89692.1 hypothetical protein GE21DRAFT_1964 [Neurospora crassa]|eukprot:XP_011393409.1 hypothetical protein NCU16441 [Neurospora crassa OR74A]
MARIQNQQHRRAPRPSRWRVASDEDRFKLQCNALQYYLFAPDAAPIIGMVQVLSGCRHHPSASPSSTGTRNSSMSSTGFVLEARTFLSGMELASPSPMYNGPLGPLGLVSLWGVGAGCGVRHGLNKCGEGGKTRGCMGSPDAATSAEVTLVRSGQQDAIIACHPLETVQLFDAETAGPRERSYATGATVA